METVLALIGVVLGAALAPTLDWQRQRSRRREERRQEMLELVARYIALAGDQLIAESGTQAAQAGRMLRGGAKSPSADVPEATWSAEIGFRANAARWRLALVAPPDVAQCSDSFADATDELRRAIQAAGGEWIGDLIKDQYTDWKSAEQRLIVAAREHIANV